METFSEKKIKNFMRKSAFTIPKKSSVKREKVIEFGKFVIIEEKTSFSEDTTKNLTTKNKGGKKDGAKTDDTILS